MNKSYRLKLHLARWVPVASCVTRCVCNTLCIHPIFTQIALRGKHSRRETGVFFLEDFAVEGSTVVRLVQLST